MRMLLIPLLLAAAAPAAAAEPKPGDRTITPESLLEQLGLDVSDEALAQAIAEAEAHPLGSKENPVRVGGPHGEHAYIARLRCADGERPKVGQRGSAGIGAFGTIVDVYPLDCGSAEPGRTSLVMDMYHSEHNEDRAPPGFTIVPR